ncbi:hypothetical protein EDB80DRAFT_119270 [Ilyonectria destructans]|nr:hypothetical protein EDB80DRAFT_119270 [Ilyonectria destructans]
MPHSHVPTGVSNGPSWHCRITQANITKVHLMPRAVAIPTCTPPWPVGQGSSDSPRRTGPSKRETMTASARGHEEARGASRAKKTTPHSGHRAPNKPQGRQRPRARRGASAFPTGSIGFIGGPEEAHVSMASSTAVAGALEGLEEGTRPRQRWRGRLDVMRKREGAHIMAASGTAERFRGGRASGVTRRSTGEERRSAGRRGSSLGA